jgi:glycosyltransferase involved in cell wall biosynthesis
MPRAIVAHLLPAYNPFPPSYAAGTELRVEQVSLRQRRHSPVVICGAFKGQEALENSKGVKIRRIRIGRMYRRLFQKITPWDPWPYTARMWRWIQRERVTLMHIHNEPKLLRGLSGYLRSNPIPVIFHAANEKPISPETIPLVARWIACSRYIREWMVGTYPIHPENVEVIYTGVDVKGRQPVWDLPAGQRSEIRKRFGIFDPQAVVLSFAGRLVREKGVSELLDFFGILRKKYPQSLQLLVAGNIRESNDPANEKTTYGRAMAQRMASEESVNWVGSLPPAKIHEFLLAGDIFILPSLWADPFPTVMLEAAAAGLPIIGSARGGISEFLAGCPSFCLLHDPSNPRSWMENVEPFLQDPQKREDVGRWLRKGVERSFSWERVTQDLENLYDRVIGPS